ncbi:hypothetical protein CIC12_22080 [Burkholderia sp. SG-MS1]|nr:hypothetical protein [Paraburkholderia sp. SG-MS1]
MTGAGYRVDRLCHGVFELLLCRRRKGVCAATRRAGRPNFREREVREKQHARVEAQALQNRAPINAIDMYLNGFHFYADDMGRRVEAHH